MSLVMDWIFDHRWAITESALSNIVKIIESEISPEKAREMLHSKQGRDLPGTERVTVRNDVAVIDVFGPIFPRANIITEYSGATALGLLAKDFNTSLEDPQIKGIVLNVDSPGGEVGGISEFANMVFDARDKKPIYAYGFNMVCSAAYWIGSAAGKLIISDTAMVGSIGVATVWRDTRSKDKSQGVVHHEIVSSVSPNKRPDPATDAGKAEILKELDALATVFVNTVAKNRNVSTEQVLSDFGKGGVLIGQAAVDAGMADGIGSLESVIAKIANSEIPNEGKTIYSFKGGSMDLAELKLKHAAVYQAAHDEGTLAGKLAGIEEGKKIGFTEGQAAGKIEGATAESQRIQAIESLKIPGAEKIISENKFKPGATKETIAVLVCEALSKNAQAAGAVGQAAAAAIAADATDLGAASAVVGSGAPAVDPRAGSEDEMVAVADKVGKARREAKLRK